MAREGQPPFPWKEVGIVLAIVATNGIGACLLVPVLDAWVQWAWLLLPSAHPPVARDSDLRLVVVDTAVAWQRSPRP